MNTIGERIVYLREKQGFSQKELAKKLGTTAATLSRYENNVYEPKGTVIADLSRILHTSADYLLGINSNCHTFPISCPVSEKDMNIWELYCSLPSEYRIRIEERILTLHDLYVTQHKNINVSQENI